MTVGVADKFHGVIHLEKLIVCPFLKNLPYFMENEIFALTDQTLRSLYPSLSLSHFYQSALDMH
jgi:hypothetical protein